MTVTEELQILFIHAAIPTCMMQHMHCDFHVSEKFLYMSVNAIVFEQMLLIAQYMFNQI